MAPGCFAEGIRMATAWVRQLSAQVEKHGPRKASWYVFWKEPNGKLRQKSFGPNDPRNGKEGRRSAELYAAELNADLKSGRYHEVKPVTWSAFVTEYSSGAMARSAPATRAAYLPSLNHFERL